MDSFANLDLGSTLLSLAIAGGFVAFFILVLRVLFIGVSFLINKLRGIN